MSYFYKFEPKLELKKVTFKTQDYLYIKEEDQNIESDEDKVSWVYIDLNGFFMKKQGRVLTIGNHTGIVYSLTGYTESMINRWADEIKKTINFP